MKKSEKTESKKEKKKVNRFVAAGLASFVVFIYIAFFGTDVTSIFKDNLNQYAVAAIASIIFYCILIVSSYIFNFLDNKVGSRWMNKMHMRMQRFLIFAMYMIIVQIILLGALQAVYHYPSIFKDSVNQTLTDQLGQIGGEISEKVVNNTYDLGTQRPRFTIVLCILAFLSGLYWVFFQGEYDYEGDDVQLIIDDTNDKYLTKTDIEDVNMLIKGKMRRSELERMKKDMDKQSKKKKSQLPYVVIDMENMKGGKTKRNGNSS